MNLKKAIAFTLAELLITLSVLGLISALTLPTVYSSLKNKRDAATYKETFMMIQNVMHEGQMEGILDESITDTELLDYLTSKLNITEKTSSTCGWAPSGISPGAFGCARGGFKLTNGVWVGSVTADPVGYCWLYVDINGAEGPNEPGQDMAEWNMSLDPAFLATDLSPRKFAKGRLQPHIDYYAMHDRMFGHGT
jgi:type II secretory pathway pseudopilin PulG